MIDDPNYYTPCDPSADIAAALLFGAARVDGRVLEIGCGAGDDALFLAQSGCKVKALDTSEICISYAIARCSRLGLSDVCSFSVGDHLDMVII
jgi:ubiquinone/menaquinone biosynthesis C-methylase UbiE